MHTRTLTSFLLAAAMIAVAAMPAAAGETTVAEYDRVFTTYPYSDPDPVPAMTSYYPYFRYDGYTNRPVEKSWKVVELSNDYVQVLILPEIGGKIWAAIEKSSGKPFIYFNHVVKFRDVSMRGPWTSGGIEANYGIIGHAPSCFAPVDYTVRRDPDGSARCVIGSLDLITRTRWRLEIRLAPDEACFTTRSLWQNASMLDQPYYSWMNVGIPAAGNLQFVFPGTAYIGHDGRPGQWPVNAANGHDVSWYDQNDFGSYKSYHVLGRPAEFFGGYWHDDDFGMARSSTYRDKPGRKVWIWGLSREGMIWEDLLTDDDGQYVEVQSGRLFNQTADKSSVTPFKHREFAPYATDAWTETWLPVKGIGGFVAASPAGAMNVLEDGRRLVIRISPARPLTDRLEVFDGDRLLDRRTVKLSPMQPFEQILTLTEPPASLRVCLGGDKLRYTAADDDRLSRPLRSPADFDWKSVYGLYLAGKEKVREGDYAEAGRRFKACLAKDPGFVPAMVETASLANRRGDFEAACKQARGALAVHAYDPGANYQYGIASAALGRLADAEDGFSIASLSPAWRTAACTELAKVFLRQKRYAAALAAAGDSLDTNRLNLDALALEACIRRVQDDEAGAEAARAGLAKLDPLSPMVLFERYLIGQASREDVAEAIRNELPYEAYLEAATWYHRAGRDDDAARLLEIAPPNAEVLFWLAWLRRDARLLDRACSASPEFVFPFRVESIPVFEWACEKCKAWQPRYYLALVRWHHNDRAAAEELLASCGDEPTFGPFYSARAQLAPKSAVRDLRRAGQLDPNQWRYGRMLVKHYLAEGDHDQALATAADYAGRFQGNSVLALLHAKCLLAAGRYREAADRFDSLHILPCEGSTEARYLMRQAHLTLAVNQMKAGRFDQALAEIERARQWPETLGAGKPYAEDVDERLEDWLASRCYARLDRPDASRQALDRILAFRSHGSGRGAGEVVRLWALRASGRETEAKDLLDAWLKGSPASKTAAWAAQAFAGKSAAPPGGCCLRIFAAWLEWKERGD